MGFDDNPAGALPRTEAGSRREPRGRLATEAPVPATHEHREAWGAGGHPFARAIGAAEPRSDLVKLVVGVASVAHRETLPPPWLGAAARRRHVPGFLLPRSTPRKEPKIASDIDMIIQIRGFPFILPFAFRS